MADEFELVNTGMDGKLIERLQAMRDDGMSILAIATQFAAEGYPVSRETVRRWLIRAGLPTKLPARSGSVPASGGSSSRPPAQSGTQAVSPQGRAVAADAAGRRPQVSQAGQVVETLPVGGEGSAALAPGRSPLERSA